MHLITQGPKLKKTLSGLIRRHDNIAFAVAWATSAADVFNLIHRFRRKIRCGVIGTHFYQTHPNVLTEFIDFGQVRFVFQPQGVFHPKAYLFWTGSKWDLLIGSANLTLGAHSTNSEMMVWVTSDDVESYDLKEKILRTINTYWQNGEVASRAKASSYHELWKIQQRRLRSISGTYSGNGKAPIRSSIMSKAWPQYVREVKQDQIIGYRQRCDFLEAMQSAFTAYQRFCGMNEELRKAVAGLPSTFDERWGYFGSMKGAGAFWQAVRLNNVHLSNALDCVPTQGGVSERQYEAYIDEFRRAFPNGKDGVATASRLLAIKRPDYFVCFDSKNKDAMCADFGIPKSNMTYKRYWNDVVSRIIDSVWWNAEAPQSRSSRRIWSGRAAMLDAIFYDP